VRTQDRSGSSSHAADLARRRAVYDRFIAAYRETSTGIMRATPHPGYATYAGISDAMAKTVRDRFYPKGMLQLDAVGPAELMQDAIAFKYIPQEVRAPRSTSWCRRQAAKLRSRHASGSEAIWPTHSSARDAFAALARRSRVHPSSFASSEIWPLTHARHRAVRLASAAISVECLGVDAGRGRLNCRSTVVSVSARHLLEVSVALVAELLGREAGPPSRSAVAMVKQPALRRRDQLSRIGADAFSKRVENE